MVGRFGRCRAPPNYGYCALSAVARDGANPSRVDVQTADPSVCRRKTFVFAHRDCDSIAHDEGHNVRGQVTGRGYIPAMSLAVRLLGTSASRPTVERNVASIALVREGETLLFDCGEGTQRQMMRYGVSFAFGDLFFTHFHADHVIGVIGLLRTMALQGRTEPLRLWGPRGATRMLKRAEDFGMDRLTFSLEVTELDPGQRVERADYAIVAFAVDHRGARALGYLLEEQDRKGRRACSNAWKASDSSAPRFQ